MADYRELLRKFQEKKQAEAAGFGTQEQAELEKVGQAEKDYQLAQMVGKSADMLNTPSAWAILKGRDKPSDQFASQAEMLKPQMSQKDVLAKFAALKQGALGGAERAELAVIENANRLESEEKKYARDLGAESRKYAHEMALQQLKDSQNVAKNMTPAQKTLDQQFAKDYNDYILGGGYSKANRAIGQLEATAKKLEKTDTASGGFMGRLPKFVRDMGDSGAIEDDIVANVMSSLRETLGSQFTENEGQKIIATTWNPNQSEEKNRSKLNALVAQLKEMNAAKMDAANYFEDKGSMVGYKPKFDVDSFRKQYNLDNDEQAVADQRPKSLMNEANAGYQKNNEKLIQQAGGKVRMFNPAGKPGEEEIFVDKATLADPNYAEQLRKAGYKVQ